MIKKDYVWDVVQIERRESSIKLLRKIKLIGFDENQNRGTCTGTGKQRSLGRVPNRPIANNRGQRCGQKQLASLIEEVSVVANDRNLGVSISHKVNPTDLELLNVADG
ncbi:hypothetical protein TWF173_000706 [Orbilia oligospora]|nr:hypothetical protein TWF173_000706 [Orbilia oligospora]